jgi:hypothetical protein
MLAHARSLLIVATALMVCGTAHAQADEPARAPIEPLPPPPPTQPATPLEPETRPAPAAPPIYARPPPEPYPRYRIVPPPDLPRFTLAPMAGVQVGGRVDTFIGTLDVDPGGTYGMALDVRILRWSVVQLSYTYQATSLTLEQPFHAQLGLQIQLTESIGIRVLGRLMSTFFQSDSGLFCSVGTGGGGCSLGVFGGVGQIAFLGGPTFSF